MQSQIKLGQVAGIRIGLHYSWFLIAFLIIFSLASNYHITHPEWSHALVVGLAVITALLFFLSLLLHELSHSIVARSYGLPVHEITLFALGGVSQLGKEADNAKTEFTIAIVGPLSSALIGVACLSTVALMKATGAALAPLIAMLLWLGYINFGLAVFNMIPGYPMDGGRILRAIIWWKTGNLDQATRSAIRGGQVVATIFILIGIMSYFRGAGLSGLWIAFIGWFLLQAARESYMDMTLRRSLTGIKVGDLMAQDYATVDGHESIQNFVENRLLRTGERFFLVTEEGAVVGLVTPHEIKHVDRSQWENLTIDTVMRPLEKIHTVSPDAPMLTALEIMGQEDLSQLPVMSNGHLRGLLPRDKVLHYLQTIIELQGINGHRRTH
ncbi:MAG: site-2 protease family protein [Acidobacteriaceae bacterium]